jgi:thioredoxin reductase (NADPH)
MENWDLIIIGAGAAGLAAGIYGARSGLKTLIIEEKTSGGTTGDAPIVENYPGFIQITGAELAEKQVLHAKKTGATIHELETVTSLYLNSEKKTVKTTRSEYEANAVIIASGAHYREIGVKGEKEFRGKGVSYCGVCDGPFFKGKRVLVVGGGNSACITTLYLSGLAAEVFVAHRREVFRAENTLVKDLESKGNVQVLWNTEIEEIKGEKKVSTVVLFDAKTGETKELAVDGVFVQIGEAPNSQLAKESGVEVSEENFIKIDIHQRTNIPGVFAAGDVTDTQEKQISVAVGQGALAALSAYKYLVENKLTKIKGELKENWE